MKFVRGQLLRLVHDSDSAGLQARDCGAVFGGESTLKPRRVSVLVGICGISVICVTQKKQVATRTRGDELRDRVSPKKTMGADLPQDRRPCLYLSSPMEN